MCKYKCLLQHKTEHSALGFLRFRVLMGERDVHVQRRCLKGHMDSVLCCVFCDHSTTTVASGGEDGRVCIFDLRTNKPSHVYSLFEEGVVASLCFNPGNENLIYVAAGPSIYCLDLRLGPSSKELVKHRINAEDINQVTVNRKSTYLASSDDSGETKILDLRNNKLFKTLGRGHANICSTVQFHPRRPWEVVTGGLDSRLIKWDFNRGRPLGVVELGATMDGSDQIWNPPLVHSLACPERELPGELGRVVAVARGDCAIDIYDLNLIDKGKEGTAARKCHLGIDQGCHTAPVSHVAFAHFDDESGRLLVSGGNDAYIKIWDWTQGEDSPLKLSVHHKRKVNCLATRKGSSENLIVADTSKFLRIYSIPS